MRTKMFTTDVFNQCILHLLYCVDIHSHSYFFYICRNEYDSPTLLFNNNTVLLNASKTDMKEKAIQHGFVQRCHPVEPLTISKNNFTLRQFTLGAVDSLGLCHNFMTDLPITCCHCQTPSRALLASKTKAKQLFY